jgi:uncharacterized protein YebE (UPF0316 family)
MNMESDFLTSDSTITYIYIPLLICLARIVDVSIGTIRIIFVSKGLKKIAPIFGFFEVIIWLLAIGQVMQNLDNPINYFAYAGGFALGNYVGIMIEDRLSLGFVVLRIITRKSALELENYLRESGNRFTMIDAESDDGQVNIFFMPVRRTNVKGIIENVKRYNPQAFYTLEDVRTVSDNVSTLPVPGEPRLWWKRIQPRVKKK